MLLKCSKVQIKLWINFENKLNRVLIIRHYLEETWASQCNKRHYCLPVYDPFCFNLFTDIPFWSYFKHTFLTNFSGHIYFHLFTFPLSDPQHPPPSPRVLPIIAHTWKPQPEMGTFCSLQVYKTVGIYQLKYINGWRNLPFQSVKGPKRTNRRILWL